MYRVKLWANYAKEGTAGAIPSLFMLPLARLFFSDPRGMNCIHPSRDQSLKGSPIVKSYLYLDSSRFPQPARHELCPCCVRPIAARLSSFWQLLYQNLPLMQKRELLVQFPLYLCLPLVRLFFSDPRGMNYIHPSRDQSLKGSPIVKSYFTSTFLPFTM